LRDKGIDILNAAVQSAYLVVAVGSGLAGGNHRARFHNDEGLSEMHERNPDFPHMITHKAARSFTAR
jgi:hypothetical protein